MSPTVKTKLQISSPAFKHEGYIPKEYTCDGSGIRPELTIKGLPTDTKSVVVIAEDPDAPGGIFTHWLAWNIPPAETIQSNSVPGQEGKNSKGTLGYVPPCPPSSVHRYFFRVYALDRLLDMKRIYAKAQLELAVNEHSIAQGELIGRYQK